MELKDQLFINRTRDTGIELAHEKQLDVTVSIVSYIVQWILFFPSFYINVLVYRMAQREKNSLSLELTVESICNILSTVFQLSFMGLIKFATPASAIVGAGYCHVSNVIMSFEMFRFLSTTFTITVYRYIFIIHSEKIKRSEKLKKCIKWTIFGIKWLLLLLFTAKFVIFNGEDLFVKVWYSVCNGKELGSSFRDSSRDTLIESFYILTEDEKFLLTIFGPVQNSAVILFLKVFCIVVDLLIIAAMFNLTEGMFHFKIAKYLKE